MLKRQYKRQEENKLDFLRTYNSKQILQALSENSKNSFCTLINVDIFNHFKLLMEIYMKVIQNYSYISPYVRKFVEMIFQMPLPSKNKKKAVVRITL